VLLTFIYSIALFFVVCFWLSVAYLVFRPSISYTVGARDTYAVLIFYFSLLIAMKVKIFAKYKIRPFDFFVVRPHVKEDILYGIAMYFKFFLGIVGAVILIFLVASMWDMIFKTRVLQEVGIFMTASQLERLGTQERAAGITGVCLLFFFAPFFEELFFRGCLYRALRARWGYLWAVLVSSFVFSLLHGYFFLFLYVFIVGIILAFMYEKRGSLVAPLAFHMTNNLAVILFVATSYKLR